MNRGERIWVAELVEFLRELAESPESVTRAKCICDALNAHPVIEFWDIYELLLDLFGRWSGTTFCGEFPVPVSGPDADYFGWENENRRDLAEFLADEIERLAEEAQ